MCSLYSARSRLVLIAVCHCKIFFFFSIFQKGIYMKPANSGRNVQVDEDTSSAKLAFEGKQVEYQEIDYS